MYNLDKNKEQILRYKKVNKCDMCGHTCIHTHIQYIDMDIGQCMCIFRYVDSRDVGRFLLHVNFK